MLRFGKAVRQVQLKVYVVYLRQPITLGNSVASHCSGWAEKNLKPMQLVRQSASCVYASEEFIDGDLYQREWAVLTHWSITELRQCLDVELFSVRKVISPETFLAKYEDLILHPDRVDVHKIGTL